MAQTVSKRNLPAGTVETLPLVGGMVAVSIPVTLAAVAASGKSTVVLVLALVAMLVVGGVALAFILLLTDDTPEHDGGEAHGGTHATPRS